MNDDIQLNDEVYMTREENIEFYRLLQIIANSNDMANMTVINKANELLELIDEL